jgi:DNA-binding phage protein
MWEVNVKAAILAPDTKLEVVEIGHQMNQAGLPKEFIVAAVDTAFEFEGVYDLMKMWADETESSEREEIIAEIQEMIDDCSQKERVEGVYVRFDDLDVIAKNIRAFKDNLRVIVDQKGGIKHLAELTGIPQPSLSRFFNSVSLPRRNTLYKIARALGLSQVQIATEWSR